MEVKPVLQGMEVVDPKQPHHLNSQYVASEGRTLGAGRNRSRPVVIGPSGPVGIGHKEVKTRPSGPVVMLFERRGLALEIGAHRYKWSPE